MRHHVTFVSYCQQYDFHLRSGLFLPHCMKQVLLWGLGFVGEIQLKITDSLC